VIAATTFELKTATPWIEDVQARAGSAVCYTMNTPPFVLPQFGWIKSWLGRKQKC
jgi:hypothetical protein